MSFLSPLPGQAVGKAKGVVAQSIQSFVLDRFGVDGYEAWLGMLSADSRELFRSEVYASTWYSVSLSVTEPHLQLCKKFFHGNLEGSWQVGKYSAQQVLRGIYKVFVQLGSVSFTLERVPRLLGMHYLGADAQVVTSSKNRAVIQLTRFVDHTPHIDLAIAGWAVGAMEIIGAVEPRVQITKTLAKDKLSEYVLTWSALEPSP